MDISLLKQKISLLGSGVRQSMLGSPLGGDMALSLFEREDEYKELSDSLKTDEAKILKSDMDVLNKTFEKAKQQESVELKKIDKIDGLWFDCKVSDEKRSTLLEEVNPIRFSKDKQKNISRRKVSIKDMEKDSVLVREKSPDAKLAMQKTAPSELKK